MLLRFVLFGVIALGSAGFGILGWLGLYGGANTEVVEAAATPKPPATRTVLVAAAALPAGSLIKPESIVAAEIDINHVKPGSWADTPASRSDLVGAMVRRSMSAQEPIMPGDVMRPGEHGFLAAVLTAGSRAISIGVDAVSGTAGLIWPGDRVDVILTQTIDDTSASAGRRVAGETVLHATRVIAIDQRLVQGATNSAADGATNRTVTIEVTPAEAERVSVAMRIGKLSLVVVAADQQATLVAASKPNSKTITWGGDVSTALAGGSAPSSNTIRVYHGAADSKEFHF